MLVSFEGGEGTGKSTQVGKLASRLKADGFDVVSVYEPGSTSLGEYLRRWLKMEREKEVPSPAELFLFAACRNILVNEVIKPALTRPHCIVIADRFIDSTVAYQGYGRGIPLELLNSVNDLAAEGLKPDITFLLDCSPANGLNRVRHNFNHEDGQREEYSNQGSRIDPQGTQRFEKENIEFHEKVRNGYLEISSKDPDRWRVINAVGSTEKIADTVWEHVSRALYSRGIGSKM